MQKLTDKKIAVVGAGDIQRIYSSGSRPAGSFGTAFAQDVRRAERDLRRQEITCRRTKAGVYRKRIKNFLKN